MIEFTLTAWLMIAPYQLDRIDMVFETMQACKSVEDSFKPKIKRRKPVDIFWYGGGEGFMFWPCGKKYRITYG